MKNFIDKFFINFIDIFMDFLWIFMKWLNLIDKEYKYIENIEFNFKIREIVR